MRTDRLFDTGELIVHPATPEQRRQAVLAVAKLARDATDLAKLLAMLGLDPAEGRAPADQATDPAPAGPASALPPEFMTELAALVARSRALSARTRRRRVHSGR
ncbi:MAG TPA: hypothetical protein VEO01_19065 [Pseudonocardiaceae bacterium]|nr:hypothetical protein [Pseudonocardiaceae bacterium]